MRTERFRGALLTTLVIASLITPLLLVSTSPVHAALTPHAPISINGNGGFTAPAPVNGGGSGTLGNPYIIENYIIDASTANGIDIRNTTSHFIVRNCYVQGRRVEYLSGIRLDNVMNGGTDNNLVENNDYGIFLYYSYNNFISNNLAENNYHGIIVGGSDNNFISNNLVANNTDDGILLGGSDNNFISNNLVANNDYGIYLWDHSDNNLISNNTCENNHFGIFLWLDSNGNRIHHNNFVSNENQANDDGSNYWDNGYPSGGNYWSDYTGVDENHGENQDIPGSDGIGDTPYDNILGGNNRDRYPLYRAAWRLVETWMGTIESPPPWSGTAAFSLVDLYTVNVEKILDLYAGSKLVVKFYTYGDAFENENVIETFASPAHVEENESARNFDNEGKKVGVKIARLNLTTDNTEDVISTIASFTVLKVDLEIRFSKIPLEWALASLAEKTALEIEFAQIPLYWALAPS